MSLPNDTATRAARALSADQKAFAEANPGKTYYLGRAAEAIRAVMLADIEAGSLAPAPKVEKAPKAVKAASSRWKGAVNDAAWLDELEKEEALAKIDVRRELGKCQLWAKGLGAPLTRQRFINWLLKAQPTIGYDARGKSSAEPAPRVLGPKGWLVALRSLYPTAIYFEAGHQFEIKAETDYEWAKLSPAIRMAVEKEIAR